MELILGTAKDMTVIHQMILYRIGSMDPVIRTTSTDLIVPKDVRLPMIIVITLVPCYLYVVVEEEEVKPVLLDALCGRGQAKKKTNLCM